MNNHSPFHVTSSNDIKDERLFLWILGRLLERGVATRDIQRLCSFESQARLCSSLGSLRSSSLVIERAIWTLERAGMGPWSLSLSLSLWKRDVPRRAFHDPRQGNDSYFATSARISPLSGLYRVPFMALFRPTTKIYTVRPREDTYAVITYVRFFFSRIEWNRDASQFGFLSFGIATRVNLYTMFARFYSAKQGLLFSIFRYLSNFSRGSNIVGFSKNARHNHSMVLFFFSSSNTIIKKRNWNKI